MKVKMNGIFDHLKIKYEKGELRSEQYDLDFCKLLEEALAYSNSFNNNPDAFFLSCQDFLRNHGELK